MRTFLHQRVADALRRCEAETRDGKQQWCFEADGLATDRAARALFDEISAWGRDLLFATFEVGDKFRTAVVDMEELRTIIAGSVESGRVVAVLDGTALGGCKFDFTAEPGGHVELLVTCWGARESLADQMLARFPEGYTFRGN